MGVGDLSWGDTTTRTFGGRWPGGDHSWHRNGLEVDIRYIRNDGEELPLDIRDDSSHYYRIATGMLINFLFSNCDQEQIIVSSRCGLLIEDVDVKYDSSGVHDNHFHLRIKDPDGAENRSINGLGDERWLE